MTLLGRTKTPPNQEFTLRFFTRSLPVICVGGLLAGGLAAADTGNLTTVTVIKTSQGQNLTSSASLGFNDR